MPPRKSRAASAASNSEGPSRAKQTKMTRISAVTRTSTRQRAGAQTVNGARATSTPRPRQSVVQIMPSDELQHAANQVVFDDRGQAETTPHAGNVTDNQRRSSVAVMDSDELADAAASLKITQGAGRTRLQTVFDKTGTHKQAELLRMLDALADAMA